MTRRRLLALAASGVASGLAAAPASWGASAGADAEQVAGVVQALVEMYASDPLNGLGGDALAAAQAHAIAAYRAATATERAQLLGACRKLEGARALKFTAMEPAARAELLRRLGWLRFAPDPDAAVPVATLAERGRRAIDDASAALRARPGGDALLAPPLLNGFYGSAPVACSAPRTLVRDLSPGDQALQDAALTAMTWIAAAVSSAAPAEDVAQQVVVLPAGKARA